MMSPEELERVREAGRSLGRLDWRPLTPEEVEAAARILAVDDDTEEGAA